MNRLRQVCALVIGLLPLFAARGENFPPLTAVTRSISGQFNVSITPDNNPFFRRLNAGTNSELLRLEPAFLAVSAERFKAALDREIGLPADTPWSGKIFLVLHPAHSLTEPVNLVAQPFLQNWNYRLELPDLISRERCARALSAVLLLEFANRTAPAAGHPAALPDWLADGLSQRILRRGEGELLLSTPAKNVASVALTQSGAAMMPGGMALTRLNRDQRGVDALAGVRRTLQNSPALTFDRLSWPSDAQLNGADDGVYLASAQLFVNDLLALKNGPAKMRALLAGLSAHENWQSAFFEAFGENFRRPLEVEKWWSLRVVNFAVRARGPLWLPAVSRDKLDAVLAVPVDIRYSSNSLPSYAEISLQAVIQNFEPARQAEILQTRMRDLGLIELRLAPPLAGIADEYRKVLSDYLGARKKFFFLRLPVAATTIRSLNALDARRREAESRLKTSALPPDLKLNAP